MTQEEAKVYVQENYPGATERTSRGKTVIATNEYTTLGEGKTSFAAWKDAADNIKSRRTY